jgi:hypothetical protein
MELGAETIWTQARKVWLLRVLLSLVILALPTQASASTTSAAGLCAPTAESVEAPPPIYPTHETELRDCGLDQGEWGNLPAAPPTGKLKVTSPIDLGPVILPALGSVARCGSQLVDLPERARNSGRLPIVALLRPPC